jgi:hypothetical protein
LLPVNQKYCNFITGTPVKSVQKKYFSRKIFDDIITVEKKKRRKIIFFVPVRNSFPQILGKNFFNRKILLFNAAVEIRKSKFFHILPVPYFTFFRICQQCRDFLMWVFSITFIFRSIFCLFGS